MPSDDSTEPGSAKRHRPALHVVTGKGGVGKTTVAAALAMAIAPPGGRTLLVEVEGRQAIGPMFETSTPPYQEQHVATAPGGGKVFALAVNAEEALLDYLSMFYRLGRGAGKALRKVGAIDFATTIAPGLSDILLTGKVKEATTRRVQGRRVYDAVVLDAPPTGRISRFLNVTVESAKLAKVGPIRNHSDSVAKLLHSPMTAVHVVTRLEEMPVQETTDAIGELTALRIPVGAIIVNGVSPNNLEGQRVTKAALKRDLQEAGLPSTPTVIDGLLQEAKEHQARLTLQTHLRKDLAELNRPLIELPLIPEGIDPSALNTLALTLRGEI